MSHWRRRSAPSRGVGGVYFRWRPPVNGATFYKKTRAGSLLPATLVRNVHAAASWELQVSYRLASAEDGEYFENVDGNCILCQPSQLVIRAASNQYLSLNYTVRKLRRRPASRRQRILARQHGWAPF